jgi:hypothetical protein
MTRGARYAAPAILACALAAAAVAWAASLRTSATFDEIILVSGGVRGVERGRWDMVTDQPPLTMALYGWAVAGAGSTLPPEDRDWSFDDRWDYARLFFFGLGNDPQELLGRARLVTSIMAGVLVAAAAGFAWWIAGPLAGGLAAVVTALLPDVLAHGGVAYNDLPLALAFLLAVWSMDAVSRRPSAGRGVLAGLAVAAAFGTKLSALALLPTAALLLGCEAWVRRGDRRWRRDVGVAVGMGLLSLYVAFVVLYRGDVTLTLLRFNFWRAVVHSTGGHEAPAYLLGRISSAGWWYYFPVAFVFKTPVAFQAMVVVAAGALGRAWFRGGGGFGDLASWRGRAPLLGALVFGAFLVRSDLNAGFRYALPVLPLLALLTGVGLARVWASAGPAGPAGPVGGLGGVGADGVTRFRRVVCGGVVVLITLQAVTVVSAYPYLLAFSSVWAGGRDDAYRVLADSNVDWGQGLLDLRDFMAEEEVGSVRLSYFGSARPEAYGIEYVALPSFFRLSVDRTPKAEPSPRFTVISATNLLGLYLQGFDPFAEYRDREPYRVLGHSLFVFDEGG